MKTIKHKASGFYGEMLDDKQALKDARKGIVTLITGNGIRFTAPLDQFQDDRVRG